MALLNPDHPRLLSFTLDDWPIFGGPVSIILTDGVAILTGRNGSGKSAILEGFTAISSIAISASNITDIDHDSIPKTLSIEILTPENRHLKYEYHLISEPDNQVNDLITDIWASHASDDKYFLWNDACQYLDGDREFLWKTEAGEVKLYRKNHEEERTFFLGPNVSLFSLSALSGRKSVQNFELLKNEITWVQKLLRYKFILGQHVTRPVPRREPLVLKIEKALLLYHSTITSLDGIALAIIKLEEKKELDEFEQICRRIGLANKIRIQKFIANLSIGDDIRDNGYVAEVLLDGINIGLVSDGTMRVLAILLEVIHRTKLESLVILEEPEQQIHPGLLLKLLREVQTYMIDRDLIISTHSPQIVSEMKPDQIHLVQRINGRTTVRKLNSVEIDNVYTYLTEEGDLGEWVYSGILDDE